MLPIRLLPAIILILAFSICQSVSIVAQRAQVDTSGYLPLFVNGALEYNLLLAADRGYATEIERLVLMGAEIEAETEDSATPLVFAVAKNRLDAVRTLLYYDADPNVTTQSRETPLLISVKNQNFEISEILLRYGADINSRDFYGVTPLHYAAIFGYLHITDLLIYYDAETDAKSRDGTTPLMAAIWAGYADVADLLIMKGANMEARDDDGFTPFLIAAQNGDTIIMNMLIKKGVDINESNRFNNNALGLTIKSDQRDAAELLLRLHKSEGRAYEANATDPYKIASKYRRREIIELLKAYNIPTSYKPGPDQFMISVAPKFNRSDFYSGFSIALREPLNLIGIFAGLDTKLWYTRVYQKKSEDLYYQYLDKSSVVYAGLFKDFPITDNLFRGNYYFSASLSGSWSFGNKFKGTEIVPGSYFKVVPSAGLKWENEILGVTAGIEYLKTGFSFTSPLWARIGLNYKFVSNNLRITSKMIRWF